jgi:hypothetical protein
MCFDVVVIKQLDLLAKFGVNVDQFRTLDQVLTSYNAVPVLINEFEDKLFAFTGVLVPKCLVEPL